jgi:hypothetical protein
MEGILLILIIGDVLTFGLGKTIIIWIYNIFSLLIQGT